jgi:Ankyrin repeats (3 copies)
VVAIDPGRDSAFDRQEVLEDPLDILNICSSLVTLATPEESVLHRGSMSTRKVVLLAHYSVKEYLISARCRQDLYKMQNAACNEFIAKSCLKYLLQFQSSVSFTDESIEESKLALYSAEFWTTHIQGVSYKAEALNRLVMELFLTGNGAYLNWIRIYDPDKPREDPDVIRQLEDVPPPLYYASLLGLTNIVSLLILEAGADGNAQGGQYGNALQAASAGGHDQVVQRLLEAGPDINAKGGRYGNALRAASYEGHDQVVQRLLEAGADCNAQGGGLFSNALQVTSYMDHD